MNLFHESKKILDKDGKVNPLGPYGKQKLTGREVSTYFRRNKVKDAQIKKAVEVALDLQGAMSVASSEIKKFYGDKILKSKEVQSALKYANESVEYDIREDLNEFRRYIVKGPRGEVKVTANSESDAITRARSGHMANTPRSAFSARMEGSFWGQDKMAKKAASHFSKNTHVRLVKDKGGYSRATISKKDKEKIAQLKKDGYKEVPLDENYRTLARKGMGAETKKSIKVGREVDYYEPKQGNKRQGKVVKLNNKGYTVQDDQDRKTHTFVYHDRVAAKKLLAASNEFDKNPLKGFPYNEELQKNIQEEVRSVLGEAPYDKADVKKVKVLEKKLKNMLKEVDKTMRGSGLSAPAFADIRSGISKGLKSIEKFYRVAKQIPMKPTKPGQQPQASISDILKMGESINEVTDKEINMAKKLSKDMEKVKKGYQQIAKSGDKTLKSVGFNPTYEAILKAQQKVLSLIGELNTMKMMSDRSANRKKDAQGRPIMNSFDAYRDMHNSEHCELIEGKVLKFTKVKDKSLEKHLKVVTKKVGAKLEKISGGFQVSDTDMRGFTAVVDYIFDKSIKKNMLDGGGMSDVNMVSEKKLPPRPHYGINNNHLAVNPKNVNKFKPKLQKLAKKFDVELEFGVGGKLPSVLQMKGSSGAVDNFIASIQKDKKLIKMIESNLQEDDMINNQIANLQQRIQANRKRIGYINDVPSHQLGQGEINRRGRLVKSIADLQSKIAGLKDKKKKMSQQNQQDQNEEIENVKHNIRFNEFDTMRSIWQKN